MMSRESFVLRLVKVRLKDGKSEVLATNPPREIFPEQCFAEVYHMRWNIETAYEILKDRLKISSVILRKMIKNTKKRMHSFSIKNASKILS